MSGHFKRSPHFTKAQGFPDGSAGKESTYQAGDVISIPGLQDPLEEMTTHSSILAWEVPWTEEPGGLQPKGSQTVGHNWATNHKYSTEMK